MQASEFEFRHRFWVIGAIFAVAFACYTFDHVNVVIALLGALRRRIGASEAGFRAWAHAAFLAGTGLVALAAALRTWATAYLRVGVVQDHALRSEGLVADGPYRFVRNPLYLATIAMSVGIGMMASRTGFVVIVAAMLVFHLRLIGREEAGLAAAQGERYRAYLRAVPRLLPALRPRAPASGARPDWREGFLGETAFWIIAAGTATFAITFTALWCLLFVALAFPLQSLCIALSVRSPGPEPDPR